MAKIIPFRPKNQFHDEAVIYKHVDGELVRCVNVDMLSPREQERYFDTAQDSAGRNDAPSPGTEFSPKPPVS